MDIEAVVELARLKLDDEEMSKFKQQMKSILDYFEDLKEVDTKGVEPLVTPSEIENHFREDQYVEWKQAQIALEMAPQTKGNLFQVPPVV